MITADAIEDALDQADTRDVERAFRALVAFPHGEDIGGPFTADRLEGVWIICVARQLSGMRTQPYDTDLSDAEWAILAPLLEPPTRRGRPRRHDRRVVINAVL